MSTMSDLIIHYFNQDNCGLKMYSEVGGNRDRRLSPHNQRPQRNDPESVLLRDTYLFIRPAAFRSYEYRGGSCVFTNERKVLSGRVKENFYTAVLRAFYRLVKSHYFLQLGNDPPARLFCGFFNYFCYPAGIYIRFDRSVRKNGHYFGNTDLGSLLSGVLKIFFFQDRAIKHDAPDRLVPVPDTSLRFKIYRLFVRSCYLGQHVQPIAFPDHHLLARAKFQNLADLMNDILGGYL